MTKYNIIREVWLTPEGDLRVYKYSIPQLASIDLYGHFSAMHADRHFITVFELKYEFLGNL